MVNDAKAASAGIAGRLVSGRYRLQEPIGRGAMGIVWRGRDELLDREVAVKEVRAGMTAAASQDIYRRTLREAKAAARLNHPGVVTVFDVVEEDGIPWIVMELVPARSLDRVIAEDGPLQPLQAARVGERLVSALACAHAAGVLHRDVKPGNVLIGTDDAVVLTDFGIATRPGDPALTQVGMVVGTPGFTAPERTRGHSATPASDLWSLGATLYTAVEGRGPFERPGGSAAIMAAVAHEDAPRAPSAGPLGPVIDALLRADPAGRPDAAATARLLADAAAQAESGPAFPAGIPGSTSPFADVSEFPSMPLPGDLPASADLPEFLDQPAWPALPTAMDEQGPGFAGAGSPWSPDAQAPGFIGAGPPPWSPDNQAPGFAGAGPPWSPDAQGPGFVGAGPPWPPDAQASGFVGAGPPWPPDGDGLPTAEAPTAGIPVSGPPGGNPPAAEPAQPRPRERRRVLAATLTAVAVAAAGLIGWAAYSHLAGASGDPGSVTAAQSNATSPDGSGGSATHGAADARTAGSGASDPGSGNAGGGATSSGGAPHAGYQWFQVTAASGGTAAGFEIAAPPSWRMTRQGVVSYLRPPSGNASIEINLAPFTYLRPLREAGLLQAQAIQQDLYPGYLRIAIRTGILLGAPDAAWRFSWQDGATRIGVLELLVTVDTAAGMQSYELAVSAPSAEFAQAQAVFRRALPTFQPLT
jgi:eukaryotic-like serine/threonine-protein kinase